MAEDLVPIVLFLTIGSIFGLAYYFRFRTRREIQTTIRSALERGEKLTPELIETLSMNLTGQHSDLRRGVIGIALGAAVFLMGGLIGEEDAIGPLMAISMFPLLIGLAYLGLWFFIGRKKAAARPTPVHATAP